MTPEGIAPALPQIACRPAVFSFPDETLVVAPVWKGTADALAATRERVSRAPS